MSTATLQETAFHCRRGCELHILHSVQIAKKFKLKPGLTMGVRPGLRWHIFDFLRKKIHILVWLCIFCIFFDIFDIFVILKRRCSYGKGGVHTAKRVHMFCIFCILYDIFNRFDSMLHVLHLCILCIFCLFNGSCQLLCYYIIY
jgi:hypothetical protein